MARASATGVANARREKPVRVLLTNDDGPESPFFHKFATSLRETLQWNTFVCLPDSNWSYVSKSVSKTKNFDIDFKAKDEAHVPISPASCVNLGLYQLCQDCDLVVSGPNIGHNLGRSAVLSSGTVGAALEGCLHGRKAIAVSFPFKGWYSWTDEDVDSAVKVATEVTASLWENWNDKQDGPAGSVFYNVNVPLWSCNGNEKQIE
jgi:5'/3'-nucleotidase SurE